MSFEELKREALNEEKDVSRSKLPAEVKRRYLAIKNGTAELLDGEAVFTELRGQEEN